MLFMKYSQQMLEMMPWLRYFNHPTWTLVQEHVRRSDALFQPLVDKRKVTWIRTSAVCVSFHMYMSSSGF